MSTYPEEFKALEEENGKYKTALEKIVKIEDAWDNCIPECDVCYKVQKIAEQALKK